jgi:pimeloyl-ACP methyl ester carboxylesterase
MTEIVHPTMTQVTSTDGTEIAVFTSGKGRPLVAVHGTTSDHTTWRLVYPLLEPYVAVHAVDRRGRGGSGDHPAYSLSKEYDDVAAVVDAAAAVTGAPVDLLGHSYGGNVAFGAATQTRNIRKLVLYEGWPVPNVAHRTIPADTMSHLETLLADGEPERMLVTFFRDVVKASEAEIDAITTAPSWPARVAASRTVPREIRASSGQAFDPKWAAKIAAPVMLLVGSDSPDEGKADPEIVAAALPDARIGILDGQMHMAQITAPELLADHLLAFLRD